MFSLPPERERNIFSNALVRIPYSELKDKEEIGKLVFYYLHFFVVNEFTREQSEGPLFSQLLKPQLLPHVVTVTLHGDSHGR